MTDLCRRARQAAGVCGNTERGNLLIELVETVERLSAELAEERRPKSLYEQMQARKEEGR